MKSAPQNQPCPALWDGHHGGTHRVSALWGPEPCCRSILKGRISVFAQLRTALPFPSIGEHQVQQQGHQPAAFPTHLTPSRQEWSRDSQCSMVESQVQAHRMV